MQTPDYRTINEFRGVRMQSMIDTLFESMVMELHRRGFVEFENYFLDGTKIEANANKDLKLKAKIQSTLGEIYEIAHSEGIELGGLLSEEASVEELSVIAHKLEEHDEALTGEIEAEKNSARPYGKDGR